MFSIIVASFNSECYIRDALESVKNQTLKDYELIIIDGGSTDSTVEIVNKDYCRLIKCMVSEKDKGIGDAWNKGLQKSEGDFVLLLNSDDFWPPEYLEMIAREISVSDDRVVYYGSTIMVDEGKNIICTINKRFRRFLLCMGFRFIHTSCVIPLATYKIIGRFDTNVQIAVDTDWLLRAYKLGIPFKKLPHKNFMRTGGVSDKHKNRAFLEYISRARFHNVLRLPKIFYSVLMHVALYIKK
ncbi:glycosyltransferase family 2 protein [Pseudomonas sp. MBLB4136]|uniref:glycosyltransferase family 2 protein n=1 Tax=Pseudomonas sp. MBLB4136 TaxID=3451558 RepID=UPI003F74D66D